MKIPVKFVSLLSDEQTQELRAMIKNSEKPKIRQRAHAVLLSSEFFSIDDIAKICFRGSSFFSKNLILES